MDNFSVSQIFSNCEWGNHNGKYTNINILKGKRKFATNYGPKPPITTLSIIKIPQMGDKESLDQCR